MNRNNSAKYFLILRFFSGFKEIEKRKWLPFGPPTIYKLIEVIEKNGKETKVILLCKDDKYFKWIKRPYYPKLEKFRNVEFVVLPYISFLKISRINRIFNDIWHFIFCAISVLKEKPKLLYCVRASQYIGAFFSFFKRPRVVLRLMGESGYYNFYKKKINLFLHPVAILSLRARYSLIIASLDGSLIRKLVKEYTNAKVKKVFLLNGIDRNGYPNVVLNVNPTLIKILFVARLEDAKGAEELLDALHRVSLRKNNFIGTIIGYGEREEFLKRKILECNLTKTVIMKGNVPHSEMKNYYMTHDIFVSLNKLGNLNNTVLEALNAGNCVFILGRSSSGIDEDTEVLIPDDCAVRISRERITEDLSEKLIYFLENPDKIRQCKLKARELSQKILKSWDERIGLEIEMLEHACNKN